MVVHALILQLYIHDVSSYRMLLFVNEWQYNHIYTSVMQKVSLRMKNHVVHNRVSAIVSATYTPLDA